VSVNQFNRSLLINSQAHQICAQLICLLVLCGYAYADDNSLLPAISYRIEIDLDYSGAKYKGREIVRYTNSTREELESLNFQLYPNVGLSEEDGPSLRVQRVSSGSRELKFSLRSRDTAIKVDLPYRLAPGKSIELALDFAARIPRMQREEASLLAHFLHEVNDAVSDENQPRDARDIFFAGEEAMLLGYFYPVLTPREMQSTDPSLASGVGGIVFSEVADYDVTVKTSDGVTVLGSGARFGPMPAESKSSRKMVSYNFRGEKLRGFALALAERVKSVEQKVGSVRVVSYFREGDERLGRRALNIATLAVEAYSKAFGDYAYPILQVIELPLPAGYSGIEFPALVGLAQAYYIDFDDPQSARLPNVLREQSDVIKSSFEFTLAHGVANQWWGEIVGSDSERTPYVGEALATFAAAYYHEVAYGKQLGDLIIEQQLRGAYQAYRMLGGIDQEVDKPAKEFKSSLQYTAIVQAKGGLLFVALRNELGDEQFFDALRYYFKMNSFRISTPEHLRYAFLAAAPDSRAVRWLFQRWLKEKHGDEDIGTSDLTLLPPPVSKIRTLGRVFIKIGRTAARPF
jgi:Peptidase family M1 domain